MLGRRLVDLGFWRRLGIGILYALMACCHWIASVAVSKRERRSRARPRSDLLLTGSGRLSRRPPSEEAASLPQDLLAVSPPFLLRQRGEIRLAANQKCLTMQRRCDCIGLLRRMNIY